VDRELPSLLRLGRRFFHVVKRAATSLSAPLAILLCPAWVHCRKVANFFRWYGWGSEGTWKP
jgi:hypothetical protein